MAGLNIGRRLWRAGSLLAGFVLLASCGGGGGGNNTALRGSPTVGVPSVEAPALAGANVVQVLVDSGTDGTSINSPFVTVRICQPANPATCVDIDHVVLDTGSSGLRLAASALPADWLAAPGGPAAAPLPAVTAGVGNLLGECMTFASGYSWGSVRRADVRLGGEVAAALPIHVIDDASSTAYTQVPNICTGFGQEVGAGRGAKGILGVGFYTADCGPAATGFVNCTNSTTPSRYFACTAAGVCNSTLVAEADQVSNPVTFFANNNNGVAITMPAVPSGGAALATGWLVLGIGTQANNQLGGATVFTADAAGNFTTTYRGTAYANSFIDSGSNGLFFDDANFPSCGDFYCPTPSPQELTGTNTGTNGASAPVSFILDSVTEIRGDAAAAHIGGTNGLPNSFDWGFPFFYGRTVFTARDGAATPAGPGPYWAY